MFWGFFFPPESSHLIVGFAGETPPEIKRGLFTQTAAGSAVDHPRSVFIALRERVEEVRELFGVPGRSLTGK